MLLHLLFYNIISKLTLQVHKLNKKKDKFIKYLNYMIIYGGTINYFIKKKKAHTFKCRNLLKLTFIFFQKIPR
jgi:hypothetical protein